MGRAVWPCGRANEHCSQARLCNPRAPYSAARPWALFCPHRCSTWTGLCGTMQSNRIGHRLVLLELDLTTPSSTRKRGAHATSTPGRPATHSSCRFLSRRVLTCACIFVKLNCDASLGPRAGRTVGALLRRGPSNALHCGTHPHVAHPHAMFSVPSCIPRQSVPCAHMCIQGTALPASAPCVPPHPN